MSLFAGIYLRTLGGFSLEYKGKPCELAYEKGRALLVFLAMVPGRVYTRLSLASMFWPELEREAALTNLRQVLLNLRQSFSKTGLGESPLQVDRDSVRLHADFSLCVDAVGLATCSQVCPEAPFIAHCKLCLERKEELAGSYAGEFMSGFSLSDSPDFEEWLLVQREALHLQILGLQMALGLGRAGLLATRVTSATAK